MGDASSNFSFYEFKCPCGMCPFKNGWEIAPAFLKKIQLLRDDYGPISFSSVLRCPDHNRDVGGSERSYHMKGWAGDIPVSSSRDRHRLVMLATAIGFSVGIRKDIVHIDIRPGPPIIFLY